MLSLATLRYEIFYKVELHMACSCQNSNGCASNLANAATFSSTTNAGVETTISFGEAQCYMPFNGYAAYNPYQTLANAGSCSARAAACAAAAAAARESGSCAAQRLANAPTNVINCASLSSNSSRGCGCSCCDCGCNCC